jgi:1-acyl-sn-glycerol-3-phosphate acyltransferase
MSWQQKSPDPPPGYAYGPLYRASLVNKLRAILYIAAGRPRSLARDAFFALREAPVPPVVRGLDSIPTRGPFVVCANHYERPGLWMLWGALAISDLVLVRAGEDTHWIAIEEWESLSVAGIPIPPEATRIVFERTFRTYDLLAMPSPHAPAAPRAAAMRAAAAKIRAGRVIGLMPEGDVGLTPELLPAREGVGAFLLFLHAPVVPVGLYEEDGRFVIRAGEPVTLTPPGDVRKDERDRWARERVMIAIRDLLPEPLWGAYRRREDEK